MLSRLQQNHPHNPLAAMPQANWREETHSAVLMQLVSASSDRHRAVTGV